MPMGVISTILNHVSSTTQSLTEKFFSSTDDTSNTTTRSNPAISRTTNQRINFNIENKSDSNNSFVFRPNITFQTTSPNSSTNSSTVDQDGRPVSTTTGNSYSTNSGFNINGSNLTLRHKFKKPFRTISLDLTGTVNVNKREWLLQLEQQLLRNRQHPKPETILQRLIAFHEPQPLPFHIRNR